MRMMLTGAALALGFVVFALGIYLNAAPIHHALSVVWSY